MFNPQALKAVRVFSRFTEQELTELQNLGNEVEFESHANIVIEGELSGSFYIILEGKISIFKSNPSNQETYDIAELGPGTFFGEMALIDDSPRSATVRALTDCRLFEIRKDEFRMFLERSQDLKQRFYEACVKDLLVRLRELDQNYVTSRYQLWKTAFRKEAT